MDGDNYNSPISPSSPPSPPLLPMSLPEIYYSHSVIYFLQTRRKRPLPVLKELAGSQRFNDWGLVQWQGGEARGSVWIHPPPQGNQDGWLIYKLTPHTPLPNTPHPCYPTSVVILLPSLSSPFPPFCCFCTYALDFLFCLPPSIPTSTYQLPLVSLPLPPPPPPSISLSLSLSVSPCVSPPPHSPITLTVPLFPCPSSSMTYCLTSQL